VGSKTKTHTTPFLEKVPPELDVSEELDEAGHGMYQSQIGCLQWIITLGQYDIACAIMTMS
jgi:hypothetical protein